MSLNAFTNPPSDSGATSAGLLQTLAQANDFTMEDLQANRQGWMSSRQRSGVVRRTIGYLFMSLFLVGSVVGGGGVAVLAPSRLLSGFYVLALVLVGLAGYALLALLFISSARRQLREGRVAFVDGFVERERKESTDSEGSTTTSYFYVVYQPQPSEVKQQRFSVDGAAYHALVPGLCYRVYYLDKLVSIEPLL